MRMGIALLSLILVAGCTPGMGEVLMSKDARNTKDDQACQGYGAKPGTDLYISCRMKQDEIRANVQASRMASSTTCTDFGATTVCN